MGVHLPSQLEPTPQLKKKYCTYRCRGEIMGVHLPSQLEPTPQL
jgi:hypothetical protein